METKKLFEGNPKDSLDRPAWTSDTDTGMFRAYEHKHTLYRGKFVLMRGFYVKEANRGSSTE